jgi:hypothetical protein
MARTQDAVVSDFDEAPWQSMLEEAVDKRFGGQRQAFPPSAPGLFEAERDVPVFERFKAVVRKGKAVDVGCKGGENLRAGARRLAVGHPGLVPDRGRDTLAEASGGQCRFARAPEEPGERANGHESGITAR